jgi:flagella basal body P-ring formation protein FlgA
MTRTVAATVGMLVLASMAMAENVITFHDVALVKGPKVLLGDVATISGANADTLAALELMPAPSPGDTRRMDSGLLVARLRTSGVELDAIKVEGAHKIAATTMSLEITPDMLAEHLRQHIELEMPWDPGLTTIDVTPPAQKYIVPDGELVVEWERNPQYNFVGSGAFRGRILVDGVGHRTLMCKAHVETYRDVLVAAADIPRGAMVAPADVQRERRALSTLRETPYERPDEVVGLVATSTIFPGQLLTKRKVTLPTLVKRNQVVLVETGSPGLLIQSRAIAQNSGAAGDVIACMNPGNKEVFHGVLRADGVVIVK